MLLDRVVAFFSEQLTAFELWLAHGSRDKKPPEQLPIVLQASERAHRPGDLPAVPLLNAIHMPPGYQAPSPLPRRALSALRCC
jgi:hypothetical protein